MSDDKMMSDVIGSKKEYVKSLEGTEYKYYDPSILNLNQYMMLPYCVRILLESVLRNCDGFKVTENDIETVLDWNQTSFENKAINFCPSRVLLQDFTGVPAIVDLAAMRDAMKILGGNPEKINPLIRTDLVIDHSVVADVYGRIGAREANEELEMKRNEERFQFLKWGKSAFNNLRVIPPGSGIVHQVNLEFLGEVVCKGTCPQMGGGISRDCHPTSKCLYPDSVVGTDSHTTMIDGLGVLAWGVGGIEAEAVMLGQPIGMVLPQVVGFRLKGSLNKMATATDLVLRMAQILRKHNVVGKLVEFFGEGCQHLTVADRATISNMSPEFGCTAAYFPVDENSLEYMKDTNRDVEFIDLCRKYLEAVKLFRNYSVDAIKQDEGINYSGEVLELDLSSIEPSVAGPKRPHDLVLVKNLKDDFLSGLTRTPVDFKSFEVPKDKSKTEVSLTIDGKQTVLRHGSVVIAAITSCTNTSNPMVMIGAGMLAKKAVEKGLEVPPYVKCTLSPGSGVVQLYMESCHLIEPLQKLGFYLAGFGCMTCIGNSGDLRPEIAEAIQKNELVAAAVLSGNRNFEGRIHPHTRANFLASPMLVVAFALAGRVDIDLTKDPIGYSNGDKTKPIFLSEIWPEKVEVEKAVHEHVTREMFKNIYKGEIKGSEAWQKLEITSDPYKYSWDPKSTYIHQPNFFENMPQAISEENPKLNLSGLYCLLNLGDSVTTDHISPAGKIALDSPAADYLRACGTSVTNFNSYGSRRGNDLVMERGTFANIRLLNKMNKGVVGPKTIYVPTGETTSVYAAAMKYKELAKGTNGDKGKSSGGCIIFAGNEYGCGSSRDWAAKGPYLLGVRVVIAQSYERIHRSNLVGMGILPLEFCDEAGNADSLEITGLDEVFDVVVDPLEVQGRAKVTVRDAISGKEKRVFETKVRIDSKAELSYFNHGGILQYVMRSLL